MKKTTLPATGLGQERQSAAHTPTPWHVGVKPGPMIYGPEGEQVADLRVDLLPLGENGANVKIIVRAVNSYDAMINALKDAYSLRNSLDCQCRGEGIVCNNCGIICEVQDALRLAESEGI